jgi:hypothetical protein
LRQRLAVRTTIEPLGVEEAIDYLLHHLRAAGGQPEKILGEEALDLLARSTHGVPRVLNQAAHQSLRLAAGAGASEVDAEAVLEALAMLGLSPESSDSPDSGDEKLAQHGLDSLHPVATPEEIRHG